ncbi:VPH2-like protein [Lachancea thermotolerans]|uniref:KLTH0D04884p n=1 Tax=Lachancea thermotolerans (strain ATCC 56472 / CBS 6340 / NRRL Y-8284) TaxID=559295 RepID=C5DGF4_LACTC|nr:KLTH0D04884p [Lachancea thermotolerans CBS 6340]CAR22496.1 KLTH0D04884p [Lachancea thermotolerans CBS 6340]
MFGIKLNSTLTKLLERLEGNAEAQDILEKGSISMKALLAFHSEHWSHVGVKELLTPLDFAFKKVPERGTAYTDEFKEHLEKLRSEQEEKDYQAMVRRDGLGAMLEDREELTPAQMAKQVKEQITTVFNVLVSVVSVVFAVWYWTGSSTHMEPPTRVLLCLFGGILVLVADVVVYNSYLRKIEEARVRERSKKERKTVVKTLD